MFIHLYTAEINVFLNNINPEINIIMKNIHVLHLTFYFQFISMLSIL